MTLRWWHFALAVVASLAVHGAADIALQDSDEPILEAGVSNAAMVFISDVQFDALAEGEEAEEVVQETARPVQPVKMAPVATAGTARPVERVAAASQQPVTPTPAQARTIAIRESQTSAPMLAASEIDNETAPADLAEQVREKESERPDPVETVRQQPDDQSSEQLPEESVEVAEASPDRAEAGDEPEKMEAETAEQVEEKAPAELPEARRAQPVRESSSAKPVEVAMLEPVDREATDVLEPQESETHSNVTEIPVPKEMPEEVKERREEVAAAVRAQQEKQVSKPARKKTGNRGNNTANARKGQKVTGEDRNGKNLGASGNAAVANYAGMVRRKLLRSVRMPRSLSRRSVVMVRFSVSSNGGLASVGIVRGSGSKDIDARAIDAVRRAAPFPKFPAGTNRNSWQFTVPLEFRPR